MNPSRQILIIKAGSKLESLADTPGDFEHWIMSAMGRSADAIDVVLVAQGQALPQAESVSAVLITGSAAMVTEASDWIEYSAAWLRRVKGMPVPVLGICFGHQLLAHALGGTVIDNPRGVEVGTVEISLCDAAMDDPLLAGLHQCQVQTSHRQVVSLLPSSAVRLATTALDDNHAFRYGEHIWGVQFHPEFNAAITGKYIDFYRDELLQVGIDPATKMQACQETLTANRILRRFSALAGD